MATSENGQIIELEVSLKQLVCLLETFAQEWISKDQFFLNKNPVDWLIIQTVGFTRWRVRQFQIWHRGQVRQNVSDKYVTGKNKWHSLFLG